jgi:hypothetical protein
MSNLLYIIAVILLIGWAISVFIYSVAGLIHILLVFAVIVIIYKLVTWSKFLCQSIHLIKKAQAIFSDQAWAF